MDFELDTDGILHVTSEAFDTKGYALRMFNDYFLEYLREFLTGKHLKSITEFINKRNKRNLETVY